VLEEALVETRLGETASDFPKVNEVLVEVDKLSLMERGQILYNHAKHASPADGVKAVVKKHAREIAEDRDFTPERIRQLCQNVLSEAELCGNEKDKKDLIFRFLRNPSQRWSQAYRQRSEPERILLLAMFDFRFAARIEEIGSVYKDRIVSCPTMGVTFLECLRRLEHSFLRRWRAWQGQEYVDFQHPSLRDLLVGELRDNAAARRHYITTASPFGIASMCVGLRDAGDPESNAEHTLWPQNDEEIELFLGRIEEVTRYSLSKNEWLSLLNAADTLVPRERGRRQTRKGWWTVGSYKTELAGERLAAFSASREGRVLAAITHAFGKREARKNNQRLSIDEWFVLLEAYYECAPFCLPFARPEFLVEIVGMGVAQSAEQAVKWVSLVAPYEPRVVKQILDPRALLELEAHISAN
jgi:hypothetical protein